MFLDSPTQTLEVSFKVKHDDGSYMFCLFVSSEQMKCFECGDVGHKQYLSWSGFSNPFCLCGQCKYVFSNYGDVQSLKETLSIYEKASSAWVNWAKSEALWVGHFNHQAMPGLPGGLEWGKRDWRCWEFFWAMRAFRKEPGLSKEIVHARLSKWKWLLPQLSYRRRVLVANIFVASTLWHKFIALTPPRGLMKDIQRVILDFFWSGSVHLPFINLWLRGDWSAPSRRLPLSDSGLHKNCCVTVSQAGAKQLVDCWEELDGWTNTCPFYNQRTWT